MVRSVASSSTILELEGSIEMPPNTGYVCDAPVSSCKEWASHCKASHSAPNWVNARQRRKAAAIAPRAVPSSEASLGSTHPFRKALHDPRWSCEKLLKAIECVYPVEAPDPAGFAVDATLRPYQRQSLAFMLDMERGYNPQAPQCTFLNSNAPPPCTPVPLPLNCANQYH